MSMAADVEQREAAVTEVLKALADPLRWRTVELLSHEELCVCHLVEELGVPQPLVSHHLRVLREAGLVSGERWRYWTYYRLEKRKMAAAADHLRSLARSAPAVGQRRRPCC